MINNPLPTPISGCLEAWRLGGLEAWRLGSLRAPQPATLSRYTGLLKVDELTDQTNLLNPG